MNASTAAANITSKAPKDERAMYFLNTTFKSTLFFDTASFRKMQDATLPITNALISNIPWGTIKSKVFKMDVCFAEIVETIPTIIPLDTNTSRETSPNVNVPKVIIIM